MMTKFAKINAGLDVLEAAMDRTGIVLLHSSEATMAKRAADVAKFEKRKAEGVKAEAALGAAFEIGQIVRTKLNDRGAAAPLFGEIVAIDGGKVTLDNGRTFTASTLIAA